MIAMSFPPSGPAHQTGIFVMLCHHVDSCELPFMAVRRSPSESAHTNRHTKCVCMCALATLGIHLDDTMIRWYHQDADTHPWRKRENREE